MKKLLLVLSCGWLFGCDYTAPLTTTADLAIDKAVIGLWERQKDNGDSEQLLILPLDKHEYMVSYPAGAEDGMFARACLCRVADHTLVQLTWLGTARGRTMEDNRAYQLAAYAVSGENLTVRMLNSEVAGRDTSSTNAFAQTILMNWNNPRLFRDGMVFTRIKP